MIKLINLGFMRVAFYLTQDHRDRDGYWRLFRFCGQIGRVRLEIGHGRPVNLYRRDRARTLFTTSVLGQGVALLPR